MNKNTKLLCIICGEKTGNIFIIKPKAQPICENCANQITIQQVTDLVNRSN